MDLGKIAVYSEKTSSLPDRLGDAAKELAKVDLAHTAVHEEIEFSEPEDQRSIDSSGGYLGSIIIDHPEKQSDDLNFSIDEASDERNHPTDAGSTADQGSLIKVKRRKPEIEDPYPGANSLLAD